MRIVIYSEITVNCTEEMESVSWRGNAHTYESGQVDPQNCISFTNLTPCKIIIENKLIVLWKLHHLDL
jgi:hypothetical protein